MTSRIRAVTALRARSDWSPSRRGCPPEAAAAASSRSSASRSARARAARSGSFQLSASAMSSPRLASRARICCRARRVEHLVGAHPQVGQSGPARARRGDQVGG